ncbi:hypothetical protein OBBRIDRAFT_237807 [Obba rivulosa]|uniref:Uncharacterized protein n=1 Tax=Obba rivulosa TaxID=1052685 RepID=A0A8E2DQH3_9APHY|nr:hypothetical protein OBBRIDRAFT_237807 [Obba rivulosa]
MVSLQQSSWLYVNDTIVPLHVESLPPSYLSSCNNQIKALRHLKRAWSNLEVPQLWIDAAVSSLKADLPSDTFNHSYVALCLQHIKQHVTAVDEVELRSRSPGDIRPNFMLPRHRHEIRPFYGEHRLMDEVTSLGGMCETQLAQFFLHQKGAFGAECAIMTALDGIPSTYVRRHALKIFTASETRNIPSLFCALLYTPIEPTSFRDLLQRFRSPSGRRTRDPRKLCAHSRDGANSSHRASESYLDWAFLIGVIYRPSTIDLVAHIPHLPPGTSSYCYLSVHFATLPFPTHCPPTNSKQFLLDRYRVAYAFFCIQHHVHRLASLWERAERPADIPDVPKCGFDTGMDHADFSSNVVMDRHMAAAESAVACREAALVSETGHLPTSPSPSLLAETVPYYFQIEEEYVSDIHDSEAPPVRDAVGQWLNVCLGPHDS